MLHKVTMQAPTMDRGVEPLVESWLVETDDTVKLRQDLDEIEMKFESGFTWYGCPSFEVSVLPEPEKHLTANELLLDVVTTVASSKYKSIDDTAAQAIIDGLYSVEEE
jgi:hypothetical protein